MQTGLLADGILQGIADGSMKKTLHGNIVYATFRGVISNNLYPHLLSQCFAHTIVVTGKNG